MKRKIMILAFFAVMLLFNEVGQSQDRNTAQRLTPAEINDLVSTGASEGTSGVKGIETRILKGDPTRSGLYTIQLTVPANTKIQAHDHPDDRISTVISGTWYIGYGTQFDEKKLKALSSGSFYTEPPGIAHFARTGDKPVVIQITGYGPTGTKYLNSQPKNVSPTLKARSKKFVSKINSKKVWK